MAEAQFLVTGTTELAATKTAQQLSTESQILTGLLVRAEKGNAAVVRIGGSSVGATSYPLEASESVQFDVIDIVRIYIYGNEHDKVSFIGLEP